MRFLFAAIGLLTAIGQQPVPSPSAPSGIGPGPVYVPERVFNTSLKAFSDFEVLIAELAGVDVALVGEPHDDPGTHRLEAAILEGLDRRGVDAAVSLEMFERDVQHLVDRYLAREITEEEFLRGSRPWPRYASDYRPLVEIARANGWPVIASNVPRKYAAAVSKGGLAVLDALPPEERTFIAREIECPLDAYFERFSESMDRHPVPGAEKQSAEDRRTTAERYYFAQCIKDETMAESIVREVERKDRRPGPVVHYNGAFHSDFGGGVAERVRRRLPARAVVVVSMLPVDDIDAVAPEGDELRRAEYLVYTVK